MGTILIMAGFPMAFWALLKIIEPIAEPVVDSCIQKRRDVRCKRQGHNWWTCADGTVVCDKCGLQRGCELG